MADAKAPVPPSGREEGPARKSEGVRDNVSDLNGQRVEGQAHEKVPIAWVHIFVSRLGRIGYWLPACPFCGFEHTHGAYEPFDPRTAVGINGRRASHCHQAPLSLDWDSTREGTYRLMLAAGVARFAPGAIRSRRAKHAMRFLQSLGIETSNETIPSAWPLSRWRWL